jgi:hypothetical protein
MIAPWNVAMLRERSERAKPTKAPSIAQSREPPRAAQATSSADLPRGETTHAAVLPTRCSEWSTVPQKP